MTPLTRVSAALLLLLFIAGCGQSGPLFIPGDPSRIEAPPQQQPAEEEDEEDEGTGDG